MKYKINDILFIKITHEKFIIKKSDNILNERLIYKIIPVSIAPPIAPPIVPPSTDYWFFEDDVPEIFLTLKEYRKLKLNKLNDSNLYK